MPSTACLVAVLYLLAALVSLPPALAQPTDFQNLSPEQRARWLDSLEDAVDGARLPVAVQQPAETAPVAASYNVGGLYFDANNPWRLRSMGNHIDRFVAAYNSYVAWRKDETAGRKTRSPVVTLRSNPTLPEQVPDREKLKALSPLATDGDIVFVGNLQEGLGDFYVFTRGDPGELGLREPAAAPPRKVVPDDRRQSVVRRRGYRPDTGSVPCRTRSELRCDDRLFLSFARGTSRPG